VRGIANGVASAAVVVLALASGVAAQSATDAGLTRGIARVKEGFLDDAVATLDDVVRRLSATPARKGDLAQAYLWLGIAYAQLDSEKSGRASFREALRLDPGVSLAEGWPPKVAQLFAAVRAEAAPAMPSLPAGAVGGDAALRSFAAKIQADVAAGDGEFFANAIDGDALLAASLRGLQPSADQMARIRSAVNWHNYGASLLVPVGNGGTYRFLRLRSGPGGRPQALFRMVHREGGVNYHEYALRQDGSGLVKATDLYIFTSGEWVSDTLKRGWALALAAQTPEAEGGRLGIESDVAKAAPQMAEISRLAREGRHDAALAAWLKLPPSLQGEKTLLLQRLTLASFAGERELEAAIDAFARRFPDDPGVSLLLLNSFRQKGRYDLALAALDRIRASVGGSDAYLDFMRSKVLYEKKDLAGARAAAQQAIAKEPTLADPYWVLIDISVDEKDHGGAVGVLAALEKATGQRIDGLDASGPYAELVRSAEYRNWSASRR